MPVHDWSRTPAGLFHDFHQMQAYYVEPIGAGDILREMPLFLKNGCYPCHWNRHI